MPQSIKKKYDCKNRIKHFLNKDIIINLCNNGITIEDISILCKCSTSTIKRYLKANNISKTRNRLIREKNPSWSGYKEITGSFWNNVKGGAKTRGFDFLISKQEAWDQWEKQGGLCAYSGVKLEHKKSKYSKIYTKPLYLASLDRKNSNCGYVKGNIQWIDSNINCMKQDFSEEYFLYLCKLVCSKQQIFFQNEFYEEQDWGINRYFSIAKRRANKRNIYFDITKEDIKNQFKKQNCLCIYSGLKLKFKDNNDIKLENKNFASIDRIDSNLGYISSNIQIVHRDINFLKLTLSEEKFLNICKTITDYQRTQND